MRPLKSISILLILVILSFYGCSESVAPLVDESIYIEFPIGKKAVYAIGMHKENSLDSIPFMGVRIYSLQFDTILTSSNGLEYIGKVESYNTTLDTTFGTGAEYISTGSIKVSVDDKWILFQNSTIMGFGEIFLKTNIIESDTTFLPTLLYNQFPIFPKQILPNTSYSVYRPASDNLDFLGVQRDFTVKDYREWSDIYGSNQGFDYTTKHVLKFENDIELNLRGILDERGVVTSVLTFDNSMFSTVNNPDGDTVIFYQINRRIVDFTEPENIKELSWYSDLVLENGLQYLE